MIAIYGMNGWIYCCNIWNEWMDWLLMFARMYNSIGEPLYWIKVE